MKAVILVLAVMFMAVPMASADLVDNAGVGIDYKLYANKDWAVEQIDLETRWNTDNGDTSAFIVGKVDLFKQLGYIKDQILAKACQ